MAATNTEVWQRAVVTETRDAADGIRRVVLAPSLPRRAEPGSHIDLMVTINGELQRRSYSVVESSDDGRSLAISVFRTPTSRGGSVFMHGLVPGDELEITQPLQNFPLRVGASSYILLAGGVGITAILNMARALKNVKADYRLVYAGRQRSAMAYLAELEAEHGSALQVHVDSEGTALSVPELIGQVQEGTELYMCGPIRLMDAVRRSWRERELDPSSLRYETFGNSGWYDPEEFIVRVPRLGLETRVGQGRSMLEALEEAGADMMFDCRKGECGLCEVRILNLEGAVDHRDVFYSERQQRAREKMCCCVSRAVTAPTGKRGDADPSRGPAVVTIDVS
ncbi:oxidoreductase [Arthrobacter sp. Sa2CUA1]|uniref:Oxidoreductase n=1 Tax=Arthrobacter gallicola TaxID=2762225 RepID=A0ABR8UTE0_9MICC|nr:PDR/VanB family oxidoreductase [Arthrobacter gallicola]MBD7995847.1 oxidoreductase [Arthrobacter gallicola]